MTLPAFRKMLDRRAAQGDPLQLWLRDDDATVPTPALDRLLALALPVTIAAIPGRSGTDLAARLAGEAGVDVAVHGWMHENHAPPGEKAQELGVHRPEGVVAGDLARGHAHLAGLHGARFVPLLVPPWNRIAPQVVALLPGLGFRALSVFGAAQHAGISTVNTHVDLIDWRGSRGGRDTASLEADLIVAAGSDGPVGILAHHLVHDAAAWRFLEVLADATRNHPGCAWVRVTALMPG